MAEEAIKQEDTQSTDKQETEGKQEDQTLNKMKEEIKKQKEEDTKTDDKVDDKKVATEENLDKIINEKFDLFKSNYETKIKELEKSKSSLDRKVSEQQKIINNYEKREMTEEQLKELEKKDRVREWHDLFVAQAIAKNRLGDEEEETNFKSFLYSNEEDPDKMKEEIMENAEILKSFIDRQISKGVEKGVNERLASGSYIPKQSGKSGNADDLENLTRDDIGKKITEIMRTMPAGAEKDALIAKYMAEQQRRFSQ